MSLLLDYGDTFVPLSFLSSGGLVLHNVAIINYPDFIEVSCYSKPILTGHDLDEAKDEMYPDRPRKASPGCRLLPIDEITENPWDGTNIYEEILDAEELEQRRIKNEEDSKRRAYKSCRAKCLSNRWKWFLTLTFDDEKAPAAGVDYKTAMNYARLFFKKLNRLYGHICYVIVAEQGGKNGRWHFHALVSGIPDNAFDFSGHYVKKTHEKIYNLPDWKYGFTTATHVRSSKAVSRYIIKYITKSDSVPFGARRFSVSQGLADATNEKIRYLLDRDGLSIFSDSCGSVCDFRVTYDIIATDNHCVKMFVNVSDLNAILSLLSEESILLS